jgi:hypothetical protein
VKSQAEFQQPNVPRPLRSGGGGGGGEDRIVIDFIDEGLSSVVGCRWFRPYERKLVNTFGGYLHRLHWHRQFIINYLY